MPFNITRYTVKEADNLLDFFLFSLATPALDTPFSELQPTPAASLIYNVAAILEFPSLLFIMGFLS